MRSHKNQLISWRYTDLFIEKIHENVYFLIASKTLVQGFILLLLLRFLVDRHKSRRDLYWRQRRRRSSPKTQSRTL